MKTTYFLALLSAVILFGACKKDSENFLQLDGDNFSGPLLEAGAHEMAVRFTSDATSRFQGKQLTAVRWFTGPRPATTEVRVYGPGSGNTPGALLFSKNVSSSVRPQSWNEYELDTPVDITGEELWISIAFTQTESGQSIGCDSGPNKPGGDWLFSIDSEWRTYIQRTGESVNWNIRGRVSE